MPAPRPDTATGRRAGARHVPHAPQRAGRRLAPGQLGLAVVAAAMVLAAGVAVSGDGQVYWLCVPVALAAAAACATARSAALAAAVIVAGPGAATVLDATRRPAAWAAVVVPLASVAVAHAVRVRLERDRDGLRDFALTDPLTGVSNRRALLAAADHEVARHRRADRPFAVVMLDLDGFKQINDRFGHGAGDDLLREVATALARAMRAQDTVARFGGDEFCVLAPDTDIEGAVQLAGRVSDAVGGVTAGVQSVRGSVGAAVFPEDGSEPTELLGVADARLLQAKRELYRERGGRAQRTPATRRAA